MNNNFNEDVKMFKYAMIFRPPGLGTIPKDFMTIEEPTKKFKHGTVIYERALTDDEINQFELINLNASHIKKMANKIRIKLDKYFHKYIANERGLELLRHQVQEYVNSPYSNRIDLDKFDELFALVKTSNLNEFNICKNCNFDMGENYENCGASEDGVCPVCGKE